MVAVVIGIPRGAVVWIEAGDVDADLVHVCLADEQRASGAESRDGGGVFFRALGAEELRADGRGITGLVQFVLHRDRNAVERTERPADPPPFRRGARLRDQVISMDGDERLERWHVGLAPVALREE